MNRLSALLVALVAAAACSGGDQTPGPPRADLTVFAAASLSGVFRELAEAYEAANPEVSITLSFDASSALRAQIELGAPVDVFASADTANPQALADGGFTAAAPTAFAMNALAIVVPAGGGGSVRSATDLARPGTRIIAAGDTVPITRYASRLLANLAMQPGFPSDFAARVGANIVSREDNVKAVMSKIELGEGDAAIVYATDAQASAKVVTLDIPAAANVAANYAGVVLKASRNPVAATAFLTWIASPAAAAILGRYGFLRPA